MVELRCGGAYLKEAACGDPVSGCSVEGEAFHRVWTPECWHAQAVANVVTVWTQQYAETDEVALCVDPASGPYFA